MQALFQAIINFLAGLGSFLSGKDKVANSKEMKSAAVAAQDQALREEAQTAVEEQDIEAIRKNIAL